MFSQRTQSQLIKEISNPAKNKIWMRMKAKMKILKVYVKSKQMNYQSVVNMNYKNKIKKQVLTNHIIL